MVWEQSVAIVVMLTLPKEEGRVSELQFVSVESLVIYYGKLSNLL